MKTVFKKPFITLLLFCFPLISSCNKKENYSFEDVSKSVCTIEIFSGSFKAFGTGYVTDKGNILTNAHLFDEFEDQYGIQTHFYNETSSTNGELIIRDIDEDLALIKNEHAKTLPAIKITNDTPMTGDVCYNLANQNNNGLSWSKGIISNPNIIVNVDNKNGEYIQANVPIYKGSSGSPLFNKKLECIGLTTFRLKDNEGVAITSYSYSIPANRINDFLGKYDA